jgi:glycosyltransferase involved in cell wall biosynthesis
VISVVIATYNHGAFIAEAIESVLAQTVADRELIVVDDGSTDGTHEVVARYGEAVRYLRQENRGAFAARNRGRDEARSDLVAFLDADDAWEPEALARLETALGRDPRIGLAAPTYVPVDEGGRPAGPPYRRRKPSAPVTLESLLLTDADVPGCLYRREALLSAGPFREENRYSGDYELWLRVVLRWKIVVIDEPLLRKRQHATNLTGEALKMIPSKIEAVDRFAADHPGWARDHAPLLRRAQAKNHERLARWCLRSRDASVRALARGHLAKALELNPWRPKLYLLRARAT